MRHLRNGVFALSALAFAAQPALGQAPTAPAPSQVDLIAPPTWLVNDLVCAPTLTTQAPGALRVVGSQDVVIKQMLGPGDTLVVSGGSTAGLEPGQRFFVRRLVKTFGMQGPNAEHPLSVHTAASVQILGVDTNVATATIVNPCDGILLDDYLEPFTPPMIAARPVPGGAPQYANMGHILTSDEGFQDVGAVGQFINIDRGSSSGVAPGQRFLVFRDKRALRNEAREYSDTYAQNIQRLPLVEIGEILVVSVAADSATAQVVVAKDAIQTGDFIAEIR